VTHHPSAGANLRRADRTEPQERRRTGRGKDQLVRPGRALHGPRIRVAEHRATRPRRCMTRRGGGCEAAALACGRVGRECDGTGFPGRPRTARSSRRREPATGRLPETAHPALKPIRPERRPPLVRHTEHLHFAIAGKERKPAWTSFATRVRSERRGCRGVTPKRDGSPGRPPGGDENATRPANAEGAGKPQERRPTLGMTPPPPHARRRRSQASGRAVSGQSARRGPQCPELAD